MIARDWPVNSEFAQKGKWTANDLIMGNLSKLDQELFYASDAPFNALDHIFTAIHERIDEQIDQFEDDSGDLCFSPYISVPVAMLWRLSTYFDNIVTTAEDIDRWQTALIGFLDRNAVNYDEQDLKSYRIALISNFDRLRDCLPPDTEE